METSFALAIRKGIPTYHRQEERRMARGTIVVNHENGKFDIWGRDTNNNAIKIPFPVGVIEPALARAIIQWAKGERYEVHFTHAGNYAIGR